MSLMDIQYYRRLEERAQKRLLEPPKREEIIKGETKEGLKSKSEIKLPVVNRERFRNPEVVTTF